MASRDKNSVKNVAAIREIKPCTKPGSLSFQHKTPDNAIQLQSEF